MKKNSQVGATLITILILLVLITIVGTMAVKYSLTSSKIATNSQIQQILMQASDSAIYRLADTDVKNSYKKITGVLGFANSQDGNEVVFCYRTKGNSRTFFFPTKVSLLKWNEDQTNVSVSGVLGFCDVSNNDDYVSGRNTHMTQITMIVNPYQRLGQDTGPFSHIKEGKGQTNNPGSSAKRLVMYATSLMPGSAPATVTDTQINNCLRQPSLQAEADSNSNRQQTVFTCLNALGVPYNTQIQDAVLN